MKALKSIPFNLSPDPIQPEPWESFLEKETAKPNYCELSYDPTILTRLMEQSELTPLLEGPIDVYRDEERQRQIELIRKIAQRKLKGMPRKCLLLLLATNAAYRRLAEWLQVSEDTVQRGIKSAIDQIRECLENRKEGEFPTGRGKRPRIRVSLFPLDTQTEKQEFQTFLNEHEVLHISYDIDDLFREALVVYRIGKQN